MAITTIGNIKVYAYDYAYKIIYKVPGYTLSKAQRIFRGYFYLVQKYVTLFKKYEEAKRTATMSWTIYFNVLDTLKGLIKELTRQAESGFGRVDYYLGSEYYFDVKQNEYVKKKIEIAYKNVTVIYELAKSGFISTHNKEEWIAATNRIVDDVSKQLSDRIDKLIFEKKIIIKEA